jgi:hypothetical protein
MRLSLFILSAVVALIAVMAIGAGDFPKSFPIIQVMK